MVEPIFAECTQSTISQPECWNGFNVKQPQGGQIGRIFAYLAIDYFGHFFLNYSSSQKTWATFFHLHVLILTENGLGYNLGDFFTN
jgi:hypothetical protein